MSGGGDGEEVVKYDLDKLLEWEEEIANSIGGSDWLPAPPSLKEESGEMEKKTCQRKSTATVMVGGDAREGGSDSDHDFHIVTERMRRKKMRNMFSGLHHLLPHVSPKADKSTIVEEAVNEIKKLEVKVQELEKLRQHRLRAAASPAAACDNLMVSGISSVSSTTMSTPAAAAGGYRIVPDRENDNPTAPQFTTWSHPNVVLNVCGDEAMFNICAVKKPGLLTAICGILERYKIDVVSTYVSSDLPNQAKFMLHCRANTACASIEAFPAEERYYQTAKEMLLLFAP